MEAVRVPSLAALAQAPVDLFELRKGHAPRWK